MKPALKDKFRTESNAKFVAAAIIILGFIGTLIFAPRGKNFQIEAEQDVKTAMRICEAATPWVIQNLSRLKITNSSLDHITINDKKPKLEHMKAPKVIFLSSGFVAPNMAHEIYCEVIHPATKEKYFYNFEKQEWTDKVRFRR